MDKSIYYKKNSFKLFGKTIWEKEEQYEGCDLENITPVNPIIEQPIDFVNKEKRNKKIE